MKAVMKLSRGAQGTNAMGREKNEEERGIKYINKLIYILR